MASFYVRRSVFYSLKVITYQLINVACSAASSTRVFASAAHSPYTGSRDFWLWTRRLDPRLPWLREQCELHGAAAPTWAVCSNSTARPQPSDTCPADMCYRPIRGTCADFRHLRPALPRIAGLESGSKLYSRRLGLCKCAPVDMRMDLRGDMLQDWQCWDRGTGWNRQGRRRWRRCDSRRTWRQWRWWRSQNLQELADNPWTSDSSDLPGNIGQDASSQCRRTEWHTSYEACNTDDGQLQMTRLPEHTCDLEGRTRRLRHCTLLDGLRSRGEHPFQWDTRAVWCSKCAPGSWQADIDTALGTNHDLDHNEPLHSPRQAVESTRQTDRLDASDSKSKHTVSFWDTHNPSDIPRSWQNHRDVAGWFGDSDEFPDHSDTCQHNSPRIAPGLRTSWSAPRNSNAPSFCTLPSYSQTTMCSAAPVFCSCSWPRTECHIRIPCSDSTHPSFRLFRYTCSSSDNACLPDKRQCYW